MIILKNVSKEMPGLESFVGGTAIFGLPFAYGRNRRFISIPIFERIG